MNFRKTSMHDRSRRSFLRESTSDAHASLDQMIGEFDTLSSYKIYLRGMSAFRIPVETMLAGRIWPQELATFSSQSFGTLILADLADLDMSCDVPAPLADIEASREDMLGMLYVLEGSALGARLLYRRAQAIGLRHDFGARHLAAQAEKSDRWSRFLHVLESVGSIEINRVAAASRAAFSVAETAFRRASHAAE
jgi:heme oxygenase